MSPRERPNVLLIVPDSHRADAVGCFGNESVSTPNIDGLAAEGALLARCYTAAPPCMPSRASILTGRTCRSHGVWTNGVPLPPSVPNLGSILKKEGYATAAFGKMHIVPERPQADGVEAVLGPSYGFGHEELCEDYLVGSYQRWLAREYPEFAGDCHRRRAAADGAEGCFHSELPLDAHWTTWITDRVVSWLEGLNGGGPFFAIAGYHEPHSPFAPPAPFDTMYDAIDPPLLPCKDGEMEDKPPNFRFNREEHPYAAAGLTEQTDEQWKTILRHYWGQVSLIDACVGRIVETLDRIGAAENTIVVYTSDHGMFVGDHRLLYHGVCHYDGYTRVPLVVRWPGGIEPGARSDELVQNVDIAPTILAATGVPVPRDCQGMDLAPAIAGGKGRDAVLIEQSNGRYCPEDPRRVALQVQTIRTRHHRLTAYQGETYGELYDLDDDPDEFVNRWDCDEYQRVRADLLNRLRDGIMRAGPPLPERVDQH